MVHPLNIPKRRIQFSSFLTIVKINSNYGSYWLSLTTLMIDGETSADKWSGNRKQLKIFKARGDIEVVHASQCTSPFDDLNRFRKKNC